MYRKYIQKKIEHKVPNHTHANDNSWGRGIYNIQVLHHVITLRKIYRNEKDLIFLRISKVGENRVKKIFV